MTQLPPPGPPPARTGAVAPARPVLGPPRAAPGAYAPPRWFVPDHRPRRRRTGLVAAVVCTVVVLVAAPIAVYLVQQGGGGEARPSGWQAAIEPIARKVEKIRGARFTSVVPVAVVDDHEFQREFSRLGGETATPSRGEIERTVAELRALGFTDQTATDLLNSLEVPQLDGLRAFYDPARRRIVARTADRGVLGDGLIAHELTHALDDQHFSFERLGRGVVSLREQMMLQALVEGDATYTMARYLETRSRKDQASFFEQQARLLRDLDAKSKGTPTILEVSTLLPYSLGQWLVAAIAANGGSRAVDGAFANLPTQRVELLDPTTYLGGFTARPVSEPPVDVGDRTLPTEDPTFGATGLYLMLADRLDPATALAAADGWGGGRVVEFRHDGTLCERASVVGRDAPETQRIAAALGAWAAAMPPGASSVSPGPDPGSPVTVTACDPGGSATPALNEADATIGLPVVRNSMIADAIGQHVPATEAKCAADAVVLDSVVTKQILQGGLGQLDLVPFNTLDRFAGGLPAALEVCRAQSGGVTGR